MAEWTQYDVFAWHTLIYKKEEVFTGHFRSMLGITSLKETVNK